MSAFELNARPLSHTQPMKMHDQVPTCNAFDFFFSSPLTKGKPIVESLKLGKHVLPRDVPPERPMFYSPDTGNGISFEALRNTALRVAQKLSELQLGPAPASVPGLAGDVGTGQHTILLHAPNSIAFPIIVFAGLAGKYILTMASPALTQTELAHVIRESRPSIAFSSEGGIALARKAFEEANVPTPSAIWAIRGVDGLAEGTGKDNEKTWTELTKGTRQLEVAPMSRDEQHKTVSFILWSSGTTGKAKGVVLSHSVLVNQSISLWIGNPVFKDEERFIALAPMYHTYGLSNQLLCAPLIGATCFLLPKFDLEVYLRMVGHYRITHMHIVAPVAVQLGKTPLLDQPWCDTSSVTGATAGGAPLGPAVIREVHRRTGVPIRMGYGTSESGSITSMHGTTWNVLEPQLGSTGRPLWSVELRIVDENNKDVLQGERGEILIRSPNQMIGYINNPKVTAETMDEHLWVHSGDVGLMDRDNNLYIVDRIKEVIKYKGFQVSPSELDGVINGIPSVLDVGVTSVYSDDEGSELPIAYVVPRSPLKDEASARKFAFEVRAEVEKKCAKYKWLRGGCVVVDAVPKNPSGKILRRMLKDVKGIHVPLYTREAKL